MPYARNEALPAAVRKLSADKQHKWRVVFNNAHKEYAGDERKAFATAWAAVNDAAAKVDALVDAFSPEARAARAEQQREQARGRTAAATNKSAQKRKYRIAYREWSNRGGLHSGQSAPSAHEHGLLWSEGHSERQTVHAEQRTATSLLNTIRPSFAAKK